MSTKIKDTLVAFYTGKKGAVRVGVTSQRRLAIIGTPDFSVHTSQRTECVSIRKIDHLRLLRKVMVVFCENYTEYTKAIAWANVVYCHFCLLLKLVLHIGSTLNVSVTS